MKRFILCLASLFVIASASAQQAPPKTYPKTIQVTGIAELEVVPDEIHVAVTLKEYQKKGKEKVLIGNIQKLFLQNVKKAGIPDSLIKVMSYAGSDGMQWWKKKPVDDILLSSITYEVVFSTPSAVEALINLLDPDATEQFHVTQTSHSRIKTLQKQLRVDALRAAREKATYLSEAIAEKVGGAVTITENEAPDLYLYKTPMANAMNRVDEMAAEAIPGFKKIKLRSEINVVFELL